MIRRTTIEIDQDLLQRAKHVLGESTIRATIEEALRRVAVSDQGSRARASSQRRYLRRLRSKVDVDVMRSEQMWR